VHTFEQVTAAQLTAWLGGGRVVRLIDVRMPAESARGIIPGAERVPLHLIPSKVDELQGHERLVVYCQSGARSAQACSFLIARGRVGVYNLQGGIVAWASAGHALETSGSASTG